MLRGDVLQNHHHQQQQAFMMPDKINHFFQADFNPHLANMPQSELYQLVSEIKHKQELTLT